MNENKINSENYESFYLDYLEGSLGENDTIELFAFLNLHPEFQVDDELVMLEPSVPSLGNDFKNLLKTDIYSEAISLNNIDLFLIAQKEGQLNSEQTATLTSFIELNPQLKKEQKLYAAASLQADQSIVFGNKGALKQKAKIILWPYFSAAAAACAVVLLWVLPNSDSHLDAISAAQDLEYKVREMRKNESTEKNKQIEILNNDSRHPKPFQARQVKINPVEPQPEKMEIAKVKKDKLPQEKSIKNPRLKMNDEQPRKHIGIALNPELEKPDNSTTVATVNSGYALTMKDVAPPVTRKLSEIIKTEVNLKKGEDARGTREGVYFKLGKFEYYRNKKKKQ